MRSTENVPKSPPGQNIKILDGGDGRLQEIEQTGSLITPMLPYKVAISGGIKTGRE